MQDAVMGKNHYTIVILLYKQKDNLARTSLWKHKARKEKKNGWLGA